MQQADVDQHPRQHFAHARLLDVPFLQVLDQPHRFGAVAAGEVQRQLDQIPRGVRRLLLVRRAAALIDESNALRHVFFGAGQHRVGMEPFVRVGEAGRSTIASANFTHGGANVERRGAIVRRNQLVVGQPFDDYPRQPRRRQFPDRLLAGVDRVERGQAELGPQFVGVDGDGQTLRPVLQHEDRRQRFRAIRRVAAALRGERPSRRRASTPANG